MDDFAAVPGQPNAFGLIQSRANAIAPRKKPLSSMTPTIILKEGKAVFVIGASGGPRIITATTQVLLNLTRRNQTLTAAVQAPRLHHQWLGDVLDLEPRLYQELQDSLKPFGHSIHKRGASAATQAVSRAPTVFALRVMPAKWAKQRDIERLVVGAVVAVSDVLQVIVARCNQAR